MNLVIFACEAKGLSSLNNIINNATERGINLFVMVCQDTQLRFPIQNKDRFEILTNCENTNITYSQTLGVNLPFKPDWLLVARERWEPETSIILEFKQKFGCKVGLIEPNSWILGGIESKLETESRNRFRDLINTFFVHSTHSKQQQITLGFKGNMEVVGNPKYDVNFNVNNDALNNLKKYYKVNPNKKQVLLFSLINSNRTNINNLFQEYTNTNPEYQYFYKPYPGEPYDPKFREDYHPNFMLNNCIPILEESHIWGMFDICDTHIGCLSSITHASLLLNKEYIDLSKQLNVEEQYLNISNILKKDGVGIENNIEMWLRTFNLSTPDQLTQILNQDSIDNIKESNKKVWDNLDNPKNLLILFDDFNDGQASKRIIDYIENESH